MDKQINLLVTIDKKYLRLLHILEEREKIKETESDYEVANSACFNTIM